MSEAQTAVFELPPPFESPNVVELVSTKDGKITNVTVYSSHAMVTRVFKFPVRVGQNQVIISGFPDVLNDRSLRAECDGPVTVQGIKVSETPLEAIPVSTAKTDELYNEKDRVDNAINRVQSGIYSLTDNMGMIRNPTTNPDDLKSIIDKYLEAADELDKKVIELRDQSAQLQKKINDEVNPLPAIPQKARYDFMKVTIGVFGEIAGEVELTVHYGVTYARWSPLYDIRVNTDTKEKRVTLVYKASINQSTGESWENVPITLDTSVQRSGLSSPCLSPWRLSVHTPPPAPAVPPKFTSILPLIPPAPLPLPTPSRLRRVASDISIPPSPSPAFNPPVLPANVPCTGTCCNPGAAWPSISPPPLPAVNNWSYIPPVSPLPSMRYRRQGAITSFWGINGSVPAKFEVPGLATISSDSSPHTVIVKELEMDAEMVWVGLPWKGGSQLYSSGVQLRAKIKNSSRYPLIAGSGNVYLDGSFVTLVQVPLVCPTESFDCSMGIDSSVRASYYESEVKHTKRQFFSKKTTQTFTRRITVANTKPYDISDVKIISQIPVSSDPKITIKLLSPALPQGKDKNTGELAKRLKVADGVEASWWKKDDTDAPETAAADGLLSWACAVPAEEKRDFTLSWEVTTPAGATIDDLWG